MTTPNVINAFTAITVMTTLVIVSKRMERWLMGEKKKQVGEGKEGK